MNSIRQRQVESLILRAFSEVLLEDGSSFTKGAFVTISGVRVSPDLHIARIYLSVFNSENGKDVVSNMMKHNRALRGLLGNKLRNKLRHMPELQFYLDTSLDEVEKIEEALKAARSGEEE